MGEQSNRSEMLNHKPQVLFIRIKVGQLQNIHDYTIGCRDILHIIRPTLNCQVDSE